MSDPGRELYTPALRPIPGRHSEQLSFLCQLVSRELQFLIPVLMGKLRFGVSLYSGTLNSIVRALISLFRCASTYTFHSPASGKIGLAM